MNMETISSKCPNFHCIVYSHTQDSIPSSYIYPLEGGSGGWGGQDF